MAKGNIEIETSAEIRCSVEAYFEHIEKITEMINRSLEYTKKREKDLEDYIINFLDKYKKVNCGKPKITLIAKEK